MASVSRILARNLLPRPSPFEAPFTRPAISTISTVAGTTERGLHISTSLPRRSSGTVITPTLGSMVQKGKLAEAALALERQLKRVDLPTFGRPTMPHWSAILYVRLLSVNILAMSGHTPSRPQSYEKISNRSPARAALCLCMLFGEVNQGFEAFHCVRIAGVLSAVLAEFAGGAEERPRFRDFHSHKFYYDISRVTPGKSLVK